MAYSDFNEEFNIRTNDIGLQLGAVISNNGRMVTFIVEK